MKSTFFSFLCITLVGLTACRPVIYTFTAAPKTIGPNDPIQLNWEAKGTTTLKINDINYPGTGSSKPPAATLTITRHGEITTFRLLPDSFLLIPLDSKGSLTLKARSDDPAHDILRYLTLVASLHNKEVSSVVQIAIRPDSASDEIGFRVTLHGDTLIASGINNAVRWGNEFEILSITDGSHRTIQVQHANISRELRPDGPPDKGFEGTPVQGEWIFQSLMTPEEKKDHRLIPTFIKIVITIKHR